MKLDDSRGRAILFGSAPDDLTHWALNEGLEVYVAWLQSATVHTASQLASYRAGTLERDSAWRKRAVRFKREVDAALRVLLPVLKTQRREDNGTRSTQI